MLVQQGRGRRFTIQRVSKINNGAFIPDPLLLELLWTAATSDDVRHWDRFFEWQKDDSSVTFGCLVTLTIEQLTSKWGHKSPGSRAFFLSVFSLLCPSMLDVESGAGQTDIRRPSTLNASTLWERGIKVHSQLVWISSYSRNIFHAALFPSLLSCLLHWLWLLNICHTPGSKVPCIAHFATRLYKWLLKMSYLCHGM